MSKRRDIEPIPVKFNANTEYERDHSCLCLNCYHKVGRHYSKHFITDARACDMCTSCREFIPNTLDGIEYLMEKNKLLNDYYSFIASEVSDG